MSEIEITDAMLDEIEAGAKAGGTNRGKISKLSALALTAKIRRLRAENAEIRRKTLEEVAHYHDLKAVAAEARKKITEGLERDLELFEQKIHEQSAAEARALKDKEPAR